MQFCRLSDKIKPVSRLCFGSLALSQLQRPIPTDEAIDVMAYAFERGVNFVDTAQYYDNYEIIKDAIARSRKYDDIVISTKSYAYDRTTAEAALEEARRRLDRDYIDLFMLHEQESIYTLRGHREALEYFFECREKGMIGAVGASTHCVPLVRDAIEAMNEEIKLDVLFPLFNRDGIGVSGGDAKAMYSACSDAAKLGIGIFAMKALGGGHLWREADKAFDYALGAPFVSSVAVGMQSRAEVDADIAYFERGCFPDGIEGEVNSHERRLYVEDYCVGCGSCAERCRQNAISVRDGRARVDHEKCVLCGYCVRACGEFALKVL